MSLLAGARVIVWLNEPRELAAVSAVLARQGCSVQRVLTFEQVLEALNKNHVNLIVARLCPHCPEWKDLFRAELQRADQPPVLLIASNYDVDLYLEAMSRGAFDCISFPSMESELIRIAAQAMEGQAAMTRKGD
jgi:DNA-binding NtrC family response regulator